MDFAINCCKGKSGAAKERRKLYGKFVKKATKLCNYLARCWDQSEAQVRSASLPPVLRQRLDQLWSELYECVRETDVLLDNCEIRNEQTDEDMAERSSHSLNDPSASFIIKGGRETVFGYKPQLAESGRHLITALLVDSGNAADSDMLLPLVGASISNCGGVVPQMVSVDDGYSCKAHREELLGPQVGIEVVSINGSKGKALIGEQLWESAPYKEARRLRGSAESPIFVLKHNHGFGQLRRCGVEAVRAELLEKILAYNAHRMHVLRARQAAAREQAAHEPQRRDQAA